ncbi:MAG: hypothetical protein WCB04_09755 [Mycobacteriales bacterium]
MTSGRRRAVSERPSEPRQRRYPSRRLALVAAAIVGIAGFEAFVFFAIQSHDPRAGWLTHLFIGGTVALVAMMVWLVEERRPVPLLPLWLLAGHLFAVFPDLLFAIGIAHRKWMDAFLGHLSSGRVPGGNLVWYAVFLLALAAYLTVDVRTKARLSTSGRRRRRA